MRVGMSLHSYQQNTLLPFQYHVSPYKYFPSVATNFLQPLNGHNQHDQNQDRLSSSYHLTGKQSHAYSTYNEVIFI